MKYKILNRKIKYKILNNNYKPINNQKLKLKMILIQIIYKILKQKITLKFLNAKIIKIKSNIN